MKFELQTNSTRRILFRFRGFLSALILIVGIFVCYFQWQPGTVIRSGVHDKGLNGIWLQHGWLGHDSWFLSNGKAASLFRSRERVQKLAFFLRSHGVKFLFPHLCPCSPTGEIPPVDKTQVDLFLSETPDFVVLPWVGGVFQSNVFLESKQWQETFASSANRLLHDFPALKGIHLNIEPLPSGNSGFLEFLRLLRRVLPQRAFISVAAYPPPTILHPFPEVHWDESYYRAVASLSDQIVPMMYDTSIFNSKLYQNLISDWTQDALNWAGKTNVLLGIPGYDDPGVGYHHPEVENIQNALLGIHSGLLRFPLLPMNYQGVAIYSEWEMNRTKWESFEVEFGSASGNYRLSNETPDRTMGSSRY